MRSSSILLLAALAATAYSVPTGPRAGCSLQCTDSTTKFAYDVGKTYTYDYEIDTTTAHLGSEDDKEVNIKITSEAEITVLSRCDYMLKLTNVNLQGSDRSTEFAQSLEKNALLFSFQDGKVDDVCAEANEEKWIVNFKKAVISTFQNTMSDFKYEEQDVLETDITGKCTAHYTSKVEGETVEIEKTKNLLGCTHRPDVASRITTTYNADSHIQNMPLVKSDYLCKQKIVSGVLEKTECTENHLFEPFSERGVNSNTKVTLTFKKGGRKALTGADIKIRHIPLTFTTNDVETIETEMDTVRTLVDDLTKTSEKGVRPETPAIFASLVTALKGLTYTEINTIYNEVKMTTSRKYFFDALPLVGTAASMTIVRNIIASKEVTENEANIFYTSLAFVKNPTPSMFAALAPTLVRNPRQSAMLGVSSLVNTFCKMNERCEDISEVRRVIQIIETHIGSACRSTNEEEKREIIVALKALGNIGRFVNSVDTLKQCYTENNPMEVRVAAIESFRRASCDFDRSHLVTIFQDQNQDYEVRIAAYLATMTCPTKKVIEVTKDLLTSEGTNQVTSFIWTHLTNIQESAARGKQDVRHLLENELLSNKYNKNLKMSRNFESSFFSEAINAGANVDGNLILSSKSFLPRSAMMNFTLDLFGESINLFEIGGRIEGFEIFVEKFFGPEGYFPQETVEAILKGLRQQQEGMPEEDGVKDSTVESPAGSVFMRMFGNEISYKHFHGIEDIFSSKANAFEFMMDVFKSDYVDYKKSFKIVDTEYNIPSISGLPLKLSVNGTATLGLKMDGKFNMYDNMNMHIEGYIRPSAAVTFDAEMVTDVHFTRFGLKVQSNMHTSTVLDGKIKTVNGKIVDLALNLPDERMELFSANVDYIKVEDNKQFVLVNEDSDVNTYCPVQNERLFGFHICTTKRTSESQLNSYHIGYYLQKTDSHTGYILQLAFPNLLEFSFLFDTPGSKVDRKHAVNFSFRPTEKTIDMHFYNPWIQTDGRIEYDYSDARKEIKMELTLDKSTLYSAKARLSTTHSNGDFEKQLNIDVVSRSTKVFGIEGSWIKRGSKMTCEFDGNSILTGPIWMKGSVNRDGSVFNSDLVLKTSIVKTTYDGYTTFNKKGFAGKHKFEINAMDKEPVTIFFEKSLETENDQNGANVVGKFSMKPSVNFIPTMEFDGRILQSGNRIDGLYRVTFNSLHWTFEHSKESTKTDSERIINARAALTCPNKDIAIGGDIKYRRAHQYVKADVTLWRDSQNEYNTLVEFSKKETDVSVVLGLNLPNETFNLETHANQIKDNEYNFTAKVVRNSNAFNVEGTLKNLSDSQKYDIEFTGSYDLFNHHGRLETSLLADKTQVKVFLNTSLNEQSYFVKLEGTQSSLFIESNLRRHIYMNIQIVPTGIERKLNVEIYWDKTTDPTKKFIIRGSITRTTVSATLQYSTYNVSAFGEITDSGAKVTFEWSPQEKISAVVKYTFATAKELTITIETPFVGWEKQNAAATFFQSSSEMSGRFNAAWSNTERFDLQFSGKLGSERFSSSASFTSTFDEFESIEITFTHMQQLHRISSQLNSTWNNKKMNAEFNFHKDDVNIESTFTFSCPFGCNISAKLSHVYENTDLITNFSAKINEKEITASLKGHFDFSDKHDLTTVITIETPFEFFPKFFASLNYKLHDNKMVAVAESRFRNKKVQLTANGEMALSNNVETITGSARFITPFTTPFTASIHHTHEANNFNSNIEMTRVWDDGSNLKIHAEGTIVDKNNISIDVSVTSQVSKAQFSIHHMMENKTIKSKVIMAFGETRNTLDVHGTCDPSSTNFDLTATMTSTEESLNNLKFNILHKIVNATYITSIGFTINNKPFVLQHSLKFENILNWKNTLDFNDKFSIVNEMENKGAAFKHIMAYQWLSDKIEAEVFFQTRTEVTDTMKVLVGLSTPWFETIKLDGSFSCDKDTYHPNIGFQIGDNKYELLSEITINKEENAYALNLTLRKPFTEDISLKSELFLRPENRFSLRLRNGIDFVQVTGNYKKQKEGELDCSIKVLSSRTEDFLGQVKYDFISTNKIMHFKMQFQDLYEFKGTVNGNAMKSQVTVHVNIPCQNINNFIIDANYDFTQYPMICDITVNTEGSKYSATSKLNKKSVNIDFNFDGKIGNMNGNYMHETQKGQVITEFKSPFDNIENIKFEGMFETGVQNNVDIVLTYGTRNFMLSGKNENKNIEIYIDIPINNDFKLTSNVQYKTDSSLHTLVATTSWSNNKIDITVSADLENYLKSAIVVDVKTSYMKAESFGTEIKFDFIGQEKEFRSTSYWNDKKLKASGNVSAHSLNKISGSININVPGVYGIVKMQAAYDLTNMPRTGMFSFDHNGDIVEYTVKASYTSNDFLVTITTPFSDWKTVSVEGNYVLTSNKIKANVEFNKPGASLTFKSSVVPNVSNPEIIIRIVTPYKDFESVLLHFKATVTSHKLAINLNYEQSKSSMAIDFDAKCNNGVGSAKVRLSSTEAYWKTLEADMSFNLSQKTKLLELVVSKDKSQYRMNVRGDLHQDGVSLSVTTPFNGFEEIQLDGRYTFLNNEHKVNIDLQKNNNNFGFVAMLNINERVAFTSTRTPISGFEQLSASARLTENRIDLAFEKNGQSYNVQVAYLIDSENIAVELWTPFYVVKHAKVSGHFTRSNKNFKAGVHFEKNDRQLNIMTDTLFTQMNSGIKFEYSDSYRMLGVENINLVAKYDIRGQEKSAAFYADNDGKTIEINFRSTFDEDKGNALVLTNINGFESIQVGYTLSYDRKTYSIDSSASFALNDRTWQISLNGYSNSNSVYYALQTPIPNFNLFKVDVSYDYETFTGKSEIILGRMENACSLDVKTSNNEFSLSLVTPFEEFSLLSVLSKFDWHSDRKTINVVSAYNDHTLNIDGVIEIKENFANIELNILTPFEGFEKFTGKFNYNLNEELDGPLIQGHIINFNHEKYGFSFGGGVQNDGFNFFGNVFTPIENYQEIKFNFDVKIDSEVKFLRILVERNGVDTLVNIVGKLYGDMANFTINSPYGGLGNMEMFGNLNRSKRSLSFGIQNDHHGGVKGMIDNFNSLEITATSPYEKLKSAKFVVKKPADGKFTIEWKRNDNYANIDIERNKSTRSLKINADANFKGWALLSFTGGLSAAEKGMYASGSINNEKSTLKGNAEFSARSGKLNVEINSQFENYKKVNIDMTYNARRRTLDFEAKSSSSRFLVKIVRSDKLFVHIILPRDPVDTEIKIDQSLFKGSIDITSRFDFIKSYHSSHEIIVGRKTTAKVDIELNGKKIFELDLERNGDSDTGHLEIHARRGENHSMVRFERQQMKKANLLIQRNDKSYKLDIVGTGKFPTKGVFKFDVTDNLYRDNQKTSGSITYDRSGENKSIVIEYNASSSKLYIIQIKYNASLRDIRKGSYSIRTTTPDRMRSPWKNISGNWDASDLSKVNLELNIGPRKMTAKGKLGLRESNLMLKTPNYERFYLQWRAYKIGEERDYYLKIGPTDKYFMIKYKGHADFDDGKPVEVGLKLPTKMKYELLADSNLSRAADGSLSGGGSFTYGQYSGKHTLRKYQRDPVRRAVEMDWEATSNIPNFNKITWKLNYDFDNKIAINEELKWDTDTISFDCNIPLDDLKKGNNEIKINSPFTGPITINLKHDLTKLSKKSFNINLNYADKTTKIDADWSRTSDFKELEGNLKADSALLGDIMLHVKWDVSDFDKAEAELHYHRNEDKFVAIEWHRTFGKSSLENELEIKSHILPPIKAYANANFGKKKNAKVGIEYGPKKIEGSIEFGNNVIDIVILTPLPGAEKITGHIEYNFSGKTKTLKANYTRGSKTGSLNLEIGTKSKKEKTIKFSLKTPLDVLKDVSITGKVKKGKIDAEYKRNDVAIKLSGTGSIDVKKSSIDVKIQPEGKKPIKLKLSYDVEPLGGKIKSAKNIAAVSVEIADHVVSFNVDGFRTSENMLIDITGQSSLERLKNFALKWDVQREGNIRKGLFDAKINEAYAKIRTEFERKEPTGYHIKLAISTSLTPLSGIIFGFGRSEDGDRTLTLGVGEDREITFSIKRKAEGNGFTGLLDIPRRGIEDVKYNIDYKFNSEDEFELSAKFEGKAGREVDFDLLYNSDGVKSRLSSPFFGRHSARAKRSITFEDNSFKFDAEAGINDYSVNCHGLLTNDLKRGVYLDIDFFGKKFGINYHLDAEKNKGIDGKVIIYTPFDKFEKLGIEFVASCEKNTFVSGKLHVPSFVAPSITFEGNINRSQNKFDTHMTFIIAERSYSFDANLTGTIIDGFSGTVDIATPFARYSSLSIDVYFKMPTRQQFEGKLSLRMPNAIHKLAIIAENTDTFKMRALIQSPAMSDDVNVSVEISQLRYEGGEIKISVNKQKLELNYEFKDNKIFLESNFILRVFEMSHTITNTFKYENSLAIGKFMFDSDLLKTKKAISFGVKYPKNLEEFGFNVSFTGHQTHTFEFDFAKNSGFAAKFISPYFSNLEFKFMLQEKMVTFMMTTPSLQVHQFELTWKTTKTMPADYIFDITLETPFIGDGIYKLNGVFSSSAVTQKAEIALDAAGAKHFLTAVGHVGKRDGRANLSIESPLLSKNKIAFEARFSLQENSELFMTISKSGRNHTFHAKYDETFKHLICSVETPFIKTGFLQVEAKMIKTSNTIEVQFSGKNAVDQLSGSLVMDMYSLDEAKFTLNVDTPFAGYEKIVFGFTYKKTDVIYFTIYSDSINMIPKFNIVGEYEVDDELININFKATTSFDEFEFVEATIRIPFNVFRPVIIINLPDRQYELSGVFQIENQFKVGAKLKNGLKTYNALFAYNNLGPYEVDLNLNLPFSAKYLQKYRFHIMTDSSVKYFLVNPF